MSYGRELQNCFSFTAIAVMESFEQRDWECLAVSCLFSAEKESVAKLNMQMCMQLFCFTSRLNKAVQKMKTQSTECTVFYSSGVN